MTFQEQIRAMMDTSNEFTALVRALAAAFEDMPLSSDDYDSGTFQQLMSKHYNIEMRVLETSNAFRRANGVFYPN